MAFIYDLADTWAASGTTFTGIKLNVTDAGSTAGSLLMDMQVGGVSKFRVAKTGDIYFSSASGSDTRISGSASNYSGFALFEGGTQIGLFGRSGLGVQSTGSIGIGPVSGASNGDTLLYRDAAGTFAQRNGTTAQAFNLYNTFTDANNFERLAIKWASNVLLIDAEKGTTGTQRHIRIGLANTGVGLSNGTATGVYSVACGNSSATGNYTFSAGESTASAGGSVAIGRNASAQASNSIALGSLTQAYQANQFTFSNRWHTGFGDCQMSTFILGASTTDTTPTEMSTQLASMTRIVVRANTTWAFEITVVARSTGGTNNAMYMYRGMIKRDGANNTVLVGAVDNIYTNETNAAWDVAVTADDTTESLKVMVTGAAATNINWTGKVILTEVGII